MPATDRYFGKRSQSSFHPAAQNGSLLLQTHPPAALRVTAKKQFATG